MALGNFLPHEQDLVIGIFFRIGFWMSHIDDTDIEDKSEHNEQKQMVAALTRIANAKGATELVREIASEALRRSGDQARWLSGEERMLEDVTKSVQLIHSNGTNEDFKSFRKSLMFVATSVARAYREEPDHGQEETSVLSRLLDRAGEMIGSVKDLDAYKDMNISPAEDTALHELAEAISRA